MVATTTFLDIEPHRPGLDPFQSAEVTAYAGNELYERDLLLGAHHTRTRAIELIKAQKEGGSFTVTLRGTWYCNSVEYNDLQFEVHPDPVGCYPEGHAYCKQALRDRELTDKARQKANELFAPYVLQAVQGQMDHIRDAMHKRAFDHLAALIESLRDAANCLDDALKQQTRIIGRPLVWSASDREVEGWPC